ncbi:MAG TPA: hypothetical protein VF647_23835 [Longimicrobium sp.]
MIDALFWIALVVWAMGVNDLAFRPRKYLRNPDEKESFGFPRQI